MDRTQPHDGVREALAVEALDALSGPEREALLVHVAECETCACELAELREAAGALAYAAPPALPERARSEWLRARLLARAAASRRE